MDRSIRIFAPATVSNVGSGFDIMGFAIEGAGDIMEIGITGNRGIELVNNTGWPLPVDPAGNVVSPALMSMQEKLGIDNGIRITFLKKINPGSGIGSSAASSVAAVYGLNMLHGEPFTKRELIPFALEGEKLVSGSVHADNVAPCMLGGFTIVRSYNPLDIIEIPFPADLYCTVVHPGITVNTRDSRNVLLKENPLHDTVTQTGNAASLVAGLILGDLGLIGRSLVDVIAEPRRKGLIPGYDEVRHAALSAGSLGCNISGSGPSMFALSADREVAEAAGRAMQMAFSKRAITSDLYVSPISLKGVRTLQQEQ